MIELFPKNIEILNSKVVDLSNCIPDFLKDLKGENKVANIAEPVIRRNPGGFTEYQKELLKNEYGLSEDNIKAYSDWDAFEKGLEKKPESKFDTRTPENNGTWGGEKGDSIWFPDRDYVPPEKGNIEKPYSNPDQLTWGQILDKYGIEGIPFKDGFPDFSQISKGTVEIEGFETGGNAEKNRNFNKAYVALAEQRGCSPEEVKQWMKENNYTWHECEDKKTMQKVPNEVHANVPHEGGRSQKD